MPHVPLQLPEARAAGNGKAGATRSSTGTVVHFVPSVLKLAAVAASAAADEEREGVNDTSHVDVYACCNAMLCLRTEHGGVEGIRITDILSVTHSADAAMTAAARAITAFTCRLKAAPAAEGALNCGHSQPCTCNFFDLRSTSHRPSIWRVLAEDAGEAVEGGSSSSGGDRPRDFALGGSSECDVFETAGDRVATALLCAVARSCSCTEALVDRQRWRVIRKRIWRGQRDAAADAAVHAAKLEKETKEAVAKMRPAAPEEARKAAAKAAAAAAAASVKAAAAAAAAAQKGDNSCAESSGDEYSQWLEPRDADAENASDGSEDAAQHYSNLVDTARLQKSLSKTKNGAGAKALDSMKQRLLALPRESVDGTSKTQPQHFSLAAAAAHLQQCAPDVAAAIKARTERMSDIHRQALLEKTARGTLTPEQQHQNDRIDRKACPLPAAREAAKLALSPPAAPPVPRRVLLPSMRLHAALVLSASALEFFASISSLQDVQAVLLDAAVFVTRHVRAYHKIWAGWESQRMIDYELIPYLQQHVPLLPDAGLAAAAGAAAAVACWPWWMPRLGSEVVALVERSVVGAIPASVEVAVPASAAGKVSPKKKRSPKKEVASKQSVSVVKTATAQSLAQEAAARVLKIPLRHDVRNAMTESVLEHGSALAACKAADERADAAVQAAFRAPPTQKEFLKAAAARAQEEASACKSKFLKIHLPPLLQFACRHSKLHALLSLRDGKALPHEGSEHTSEMPLVDLQESSLKALLHPALAASPHLTPFSFCENSTDPSWLAEAPASWIMAMSGAVSAQQLQSTHQELVSQWAKFAAEALQSPIPQKIGLTDVPDAQPWHQRMTALRNLHGASAIPQPDALTVSHFFGSCCK